MEEKKVKFENLQTDETELTNICEGDKCKYDLDDLEIATHLVCDPIELGKLTNV
jgi:hypothetical protein